MWNPLLRFAARLPADMGIPFHWNSMYRRLHHPWWTYAIYNMTGLCCPDWGVKFLPPPHSNESLERRQSRYYILIYQKCESYPVLVLVIIPIPMIVHMFNYGCCVPCLCCSCVACWSCCSASCRAARPGTSFSCYSSNPAPPTHATHCCSTTSTRTDSGNSCSRWASSLFSSSCSRTLENPFIIFFFFDLAQLFERMLRCDRVYEKNKQRLRLREAGYAGLSLLFSELHITPTLVRCLLNQVLHTGLFPALWSNAFSSCSCFCC